MQQFVKTKLITLMREPTKKVAPDIEWEKSHKMFAKTVFMANTIYFCVNL
jgi:hypothetical protein